MVCENCGKEHDGFYGSGRFCCKECARSYSTKNMNHNELKITYCKDCGKEILIKKNGTMNNYCRCDECKRLQKTQTCKICGNKYPKGIGGCPNNFCRNHNLKQIKTLIKYFGFNKTKLGTVNVEKEFNRVRQELYDYYWKDQKSFCDISNIYNYDKHPGNLTKIFTYLNIPRRTFKETAKLTYFNGKQDNKITNNQYKSKWYITWNDKEVYLRSSYELDYAKELDKQKIDYEVEGLKIKYWDSQRNDYRCAIPDFYIPSESLIIEIKSSWTLDLQNMKDRKKAYVELGYNFKCICDHKEIEI